MNKIIKEDFSTSILDGATKICGENRTMSTYDLHNGEILKILEPDVIRNMKIPFEKYLADLDYKISLSENIDVPDIVCPMRALYDDNGIRAYTTAKVVSGIPLIKILPAYCKRGELQLYSHIFTKLTERVKLINNSGIILPDLGNATNTFYEPKTDSFKFIDYDGMQIEDSKSFSYSAFLPIYKNPIFRSRKYRQKNNLYTENLDKLSILILYLYYTTGINIMDIDRNTNAGYSFNRDFEEKDIPLPNMSIMIDFFDNYGIAPEMESLVNLAYNHRHDNIYPDEVIEKVAREYKLVPKRNGFAKIKN